MNLSQLLSKSERGKFVIYEPNFFPTPWSVCKVSMKIRFCAALDF